MAICDPRRFSLEDMAECSARLRTLGGQGRTFGEVADAVVRFLYEHLRDSQTGMPSCALVRCFKTQAYATLSEDFRRFVRAVLGIQRPSPDLKCLALAATAGERPEWNHVTESRRYKAIPLAGERFAGQFPMFAQLFTQLGLPMNASSDGADLLLDDGPRSYHVFFVPEAVGSPYVPVQQDFVVQYGIRSVLGYGGVLPSQEVFVVVLFATVRLPRQTAELFKTLALSTQLAFLEAEARAVEETHAQQNRHPQQVTAHPYDARIQACEQLLAVQEETVTAYAKRGRCAQDAPADNRARFSPVAESSRDPVLFVDQDGKIQSWTRTAEALFGYCAGEAVGKSIQVLFGDDFMPTFAGLVEEKTSERAPGVTGHTCDAVGRRMDGGVFPAEVVIAAWWTKHAPCFTFIIRDISERLRAAAELTHSEARLRSLIDHAPDLICTTTIDGTITSLNPAFEAITRWPRSEWVGRHFAALLHPDDAPYARDVLEYIIKTRTSITSGLRIRSKDRGMIAGDFVGGPLIENGRVVGVFGIARDITDRKLFEEALRESEERLRAVLQSTQDAIITIDGKGDVVFWNDAARKLFGYTPEEILGYPVSRIIPERFREAHARGLKRAAAAGQRTVEGTMFELVGLRKDETEFPLEFSLASWRGRVGLFFTSIIRDVTERKRAEAERERLARHVQLLLASTGEGIYGIDTAGRCTFINDAAARLLGYRADEVIGKRMHELIHHHRSDQSVYPLEACPIYRAFRSGQTMEADDEVLWRKDGTPLPVHYSSAPIMEEGIVTGAVVIFTDISRRKQAELKVLESEARYRQLVETAMEGMWLIDAEDKTQFVNRRLAEMLGYDVADMLGRPLYDFFEAGECDFLHERIAARRRGIKEQYDLRFRRKDGSRLWAIVSASPVFSPEGRYTGALAMITDITDRKRTEEAMNALLQGTASVTGKEFFPAFVRHLAAALNVEYAMVVERPCPDSRTCRVMAAWMRDRLVEPFDYDLVGTPCETLMKADQVYYPSDVQQLFPLDRDLMTMQAVSYAGVALRDSASRELGHLCVLDLKPLMDRDNVMRILAIFGSRAAAELERMQAEAAVQDAQERLKLSLEATDLGIWDWNIETGRVVWSEQVPPIFGLTRESFDGTYESYFRCLHPDDRGLVSQAIEASLHDGADYEVEHRIVRPDGRIRWVACKGDVLCDEDGRAVRMLGTVQDITDRKEADARLHAMLKQVRTLSGRLEVIREEERARIARELHDELGVGLTCLKIDLTRIKSLLSNAGPTREPIDERLDRMIEYVDETIRSVQRIVTELRPTVLDDLGLVAAIEWLAQDFERRTGIVCRCTIASDEFPADIERTTAVFRICQEALTNVVRHAAASAVGIRLGRDGDRLELDVSDNGCGIPEHKLAEPQSLGLLGMKERAELLGGKVTIKHGVRGGTIVSLRLPYPYPSESS